MKQDKIVTKYSGNFEIDSKLMEAHASELNYLLNEFSKSKKNEDISIVFTFEEGSISIISMIITKAAVDISYYVGKKAFIGLIQVFKNAIKNSKMIEKKIANKAIKEIIKGSRNNDDDKLIIIIFEDDSKFEIEEWIFDSMKKKKYSDLRKKTNKIIFEQKREQSIMIDEQEIEFSLEEIRSLSNISIKDKLSNEEIKITEEIKKGKIYFSSELPNKNTPVGKFNSLSFKKRKINNINFIGESLDHDANNFVYKKNAESYIEADFKLLSFYDDENNARHEIEVSKIYKIVKPQLSTTEDKDPFNLFDDHENNL